MHSELKRGDLAKILDQQSIEGIELDEIIARFQAEIQGSHLPESFFRVDPRTGDRIVYSAARSSRPHDNRPASEANIPEKDCVICRGETTGVIDVADLSEGFTFINKNLFPAFFPFDAGYPSGMDSVEAEQEFAQGLHILQWTSSIHDTDWHNLNADDRVIVMQRLAALERTLLRSASGQPTRSRSPHEKTHVLIFKNYGHSVGASLSHGHQQIVWTNVIPRTALDNLRFLEEHGETFSAYMLRETPSGLVIKDYGPAMMSIPQFMRRPYAMMLFIKDPQKSYLHELSPAEIGAVAEGWNDATRFFHWMMPRIGKDVAYNIITHTGPGAGLYVEFLPYTQPTGGLEHMGLYVCQELPERAADRSRDFIKGERKPL